jgi:hypothetical protein
MLKVKNAKMLKVQKYWNVKSNAKMLKVKNTKMLKVIKSLYVFRALK